MIHGEPRANARTDQIQLTKAPERPPPATLHWLPRQIWEFEVHAMVQPNNIVAILVVFLVFLLPALCAIILCQLAAMTRRAMSASYTTSSTGSSQEIVDDGSVGDGGFQRQDQAGGVHDEESPPRSFH